MSRGAGPKTEHGFRGSASLVSSTGDDHCLGAAAHTNSSTSRDDSCPPGHPAASCSTGNRPGPQVSLQPLCPLPVVLHKVVLTQVQDPERFLVECHTINP